MKTNSSAKKRFSFTGSGKIKRNHASASHLKRKKSKRAKLVLSHSTLVSKADTKRVKKLLAKG